MNISPELVAWIVAGGTTALAFTTLLVLAFTVGSQSDATRNLTTILSDTISSRDNLELEALKMELELEKSKSSKHLEEINE